MKITILALQCRPVELDGDGVLTAAGGFSKLGNGDKRAQTFFAALGVKRVKWNGANTGLFSLITDDAERPRKDPLHLDNIPHTGPYLAKSWRESMAALRAGRERNQSSANLRLDRKVFAANQALFEIAGQPTHAALFPDALAGLQLEVADPRDLRLVGGRVTETVCVDELLTGYNVITQPDLLGGDLHQPVKVELRLDGPQPALTASISLADLDRIEAWRMRLSFTAIKRGTVLERVTNLRLSDRMGQQLQLSSLAVV